MGYRPFLVNSKSVSLHFWNNDDLYNDLIIYFHTSMVRKKNVSDFNLGHFFHQTNLNFNSSPYFFCASTDMDSSLNCSMRG